MNKLVSLMLVATLLIGSSVVMVMAQGEPESFTGCLTAGGTLVRLAVGDEPAQPCSESQTEISWNSADIPVIDERPGLYTHLCNAILLPGGGPVDVMVLEIPEGDWMATISIQTGGLGPCGGGHPLEGQSLDGNFDCTLTGIATGGHPASSRVGEFRTIAWSEPISLNETTTVAVTCQFFEGSGDGATLSVGDFSVIPVIGVESQP